jgi:hypothetical protein
VTVCISKTSFKIEKKIQDKKKKKVFICCRKTVFNIDFETF